MLWEMWRYSSYGWISCWIEPSFHFTYFGFDWVRPWPGSGMYIHFGVMALLALFILLGLWYRLSATLFFLGFSYIFLLEQAQYLNHFYLICLIAFIMIFLPANRAWALDAWRRPDGRTPQQLIDPTVNLAAQPRTPWPVDWILPLTMPLVAEAP